MRGMEGKPRKGANPKCERVRLMKKCPKIGRLKIQKQCFNDIIQEKGGIAEKNMDLSFSRNYLTPSQSKVSLAIYKTCFTKILTPAQALHSGHIYLRKTSL